MDDRTIINMEPSPLIFKELDNYMGKPVWDKIRKCWRVIDGYKRFNNKYLVSFTDYDGFIEFEYVNLYTTEV